MSFSSRLFSLVWMVLGLYVLEAAGKDAKSSVGRPDVADGDTGIPGFPGLFKAMNIGFDEKKEGNMLRIQVRFKELLDTMMSPKAAASETSEVQRIPSVKYKHHEIGASIVKQTRRRPANPHQHRAASTSADGRRSPFAVRVSAKKMHPFLKQADTVRSAPSLSGGKPQRKEMRKKSSTSPSTGGHQQQVRDPTISRQIEYLNKLLAMKPTVAPASVPGNGYNPAPGHGYPVPAHGYNPAPAHGYNPAPARGYNPVPGHRYPVAAHGYNPVTMTR